MLSFPYHYVYLYILFIYSLLQHEGIRILSASYRSETEASISKYLACRIYHFYPVTTLKIISLFGH